MGRIQRCETVILAFICGSFPPSVLHSADSAPAVMGCLLLAVTQRNNNGNQIIPKRFTHNHTHRQTCALSNNRLGLRQQKVIVARAHVGSTLLETNVFAQAILCPKNQTEGQSENNKDPHRKSNVPLSRKTNAIFTFHYIRTTPSQWFQSSHERQTIIESISTSELRNTLISLRWA